MRSLLSRPVLILVIPILVFVSGSYLIIHFTSRDQISEGNEPEAKPLHMMATGYNQKVAIDYWDWLRRNDGLVAEQRFLKADLVFPIFYGVAVLASILIAWNWLKRWLSAALLVMSITATALSDWTENLVHLRQLDRFVQGESLQSLCIQVASAATTSKFVFGAASLILLVYWYIRVLQSRKVNSR